MKQTIAGQEVWATTQGDGAPRLFIHCSLAQSETLFGLAEALPPARNIYFDLPGHGRSGPWGGTAYQTDAFEIAAELLDGPAHVIGHSFGGTVAARLAVERPELMSRLTLIEPVLMAAAEGTAAHADHQIEFAPFVAAWENRDLEAASAEFLKLWGAGPAFEALPPKMQSAISKRIHLIPAANEAVEHDAFEVLSRLDRVTSPVDLIEGSASQPIISAVMDALQKKLPQAIRHIIKGAGHMMPISHAKQVAAALLD